jgi:hypothetical protein
VTESRKEKEEGKKRRKDKRKEEKRERFVQGISHVFVSSI